MPTTIPSPSPTPTSVRGSRRARRTLVWGGLALGFVLLVGAFLVFRPDKLVLDDKVNEALPSGVVAATSNAAASNAAASNAAAPTDDGAAAAASPVTAPGGESAVTRPAAGAPAEVARGTFRSLEHETTGRAIVFDAGSGSRILRLEDLDTSNGPDLRVILSSAPLSSDSRVWGDDYVEIARLKGNKGSQNYELAADIDLARYGRVVVWCDRFDVGFGVAELV